MSIINSLNVMLPFLREELYGKIKVVSGVMMVTDSKKDN